MRHPGPARIEPSWTLLKKKPLANEPDGQAGPTVVPGEYRVAMTVGSAAQTVGFPIVKDPRVPTSAEGYASQFALLKQLHDKLSTLNEAVNRIRRVRSQLVALAELAGADHADIVDAAKSAGGSLTAIEGVLVDVNRESPRDALRHPAGLNDTLVDLINTVAIADMAPTVPAIAVSRQIMASVDGEIAKLDALLATDIAAINRMAAERSIARVAG